MQVSWHFLAYCFKVQTCTKRYNICMIGLYNLCVKNSPVTTSMTKFFGLNSELFYYQLRAMERSLPHLAGIRSKPIKNANNSRFLHSVDDYKLWCRSVLIFFRQKTKLLVKLKLARVWNRVNISQSHLSPLVINHLFWKNAVGINDY